MRTLPPLLDPLATIGVPLERLPRHVAIIMDGNGRWAQQRGAPRLEGHRHGANAAREAIRACSDLGIGCLTLYSFSVENWKRPAPEVAGLMGLYAHHLAIERAELHEKQVRVVAIGRRAGLPAEVQRELDATCALTANNPGLRLCLALNYGSRAEITDGVRAIAERVARGELRPADIDEQVISEALDTRGLPDPDLVIRTAGEMRISNFLLWQISYAELWVTPVLWPDFAPADLHAALRTFAGRERRFGDVPAAPRA